MPLAVMLNDVEFCDPLPSAPRLPVMLKLVNPLMSPAQMNAVAVGPHTLEPITRVK